RNGFLAKLRDERGMRGLVARAGFFRHRFRQLHQAPHALGKRAPIREQVALMTDLADAQEEREQAAVPVAKPGSVKGQLGGLGRGVELFQYKVRLRQAVTKMP